jgi:hypothetical protein
MPPFKILYDLGAEKTDIESSEMFFCKPSHMSLNQIVTWYLLIVNQSTMSTFAITSINQPLFIPSASNKTLLHQFFLNLSQKQCWKQNVQSFNLT